MGTGAVFVGRGVGTHFKVMNLVPEPTGGRRGAGLGEGQDVGFRDGKRGRDLS